MRKLKEEETRKSFEQEIINSVKTDKANHQKKNIFKKR